MIYLNVSYDQKDHAKSLGAKWDAQKKKWYAPDETFTDLIETYGGGGGGGGGSGSTSSTQQKSGGVRINKIPYSGGGGGGGGSFSSYGSGSGSGSGSSAAAAKSKVSIHKANHPSSRTPQQECCFDDDD